MDGEGMPTLLEAYGAYGAPFPPSFNAGRISILDRRAWLICSLAKPGLVLAQSRPSPVLPVRCNSATGWLPVTDSRIARSHA